MCMAYMSHCGHLSRNINPIPQKMMTTEKVDSTASQETYVHLARLAHDSFEQRRSYEWKMHFGLWAAIAAVVYTAIKEKIVVFECEPEAIII